MANINYYLAGTAGYAEAAKSMLNSLLMQPKLGRNAYVKRSIQIIDEMLINISIVLKEVPLKESKEELKSYLEVLYNGGSTLMELNIMLNRTSDGARYGDVLYRIRSYVDSIKGTLSEAAPEVVRLYGVKGAMSIVNPTFQALSGIWEEYHKSLEAQQEQALYTSAAVFKESEYKT